MAGLPGHPDPYDGEVTRYFEDLAIGDTYDVGQKTLTEDEIISFAEQFDPQPFHTDVDAARESVFGGLIASGLHTFCTWSRLATDALLGRLMNLGGAGIDGMRWHVPVRPGDTLRGRATVMEGTRLSVSKPDRGILVVRAELENQHGQLVWQADVTSLIARRPSTSGA